MVEFNYNREDNWNTGIILNTAALPSDKYPHFFDKRCK
jgi:hypothetical protein